MSIQMSLSVPALERLIKDDPEMELKLKDGVIANFVDKHLRGLLRDDLLKSKIEELSNRINEEVHNRTKSEFGSLSKNWPNAFTFNKAFTDQMSVVASIKVKESIDQLVTEKMDAYFKSKDIEAMFRTYIDTKVANLTNRMIEDKAKELLSSAIIKK